MGAPTAAVTAQRHPPPPPPPPGVQRAIQAIRCFKDKSFVRWPPHVNLLYPFCEDDHDAGGGGGGGVFEAAAATAAQALAHLQPFRVRFDELAFFEHSPRSFTMWLKPADTAGLASVQAALQAAFPECTDLASDPSRGIECFTPHLSLGQWRDKQQLLAAVQEYSAQEYGLLGMEFEVQEVCLCSRRGYRDPFSVRYAVPLGAATRAAAYAAPQRVDAPYIATTSTDALARLAAAQQQQQPAQQRQPAQQQQPAQPQQQRQQQQQQQQQPAQQPARPLNEALGAALAQPDRARFGLGAAPQGVWNFAFGANMSPRKLGAARGLRPAASLPGLLPGHRLAFNHRGGFGNIVPTHAPASAGASAGAGAAVGDAAAAAAAVGTAAPPAVHGVLHRLSPAELAELMCMEHECEPVVVFVQPYPAGATPAAAPATAAGAPAPAPAPVPAAAAAASSSHPAGGTGAGAEVPAAAAVPAAASMADPAAAAAAVSAGAVPPAASEPGEQQQQQDAPHPASSGLQQPPLVPAIAFMTPPSRCIQEGLPPTQRYLDLLVEGAAHWRLEAAYQAWLAGQAALPEGAKRGDAYYTSAQGEPLPAWPKIRTGGRDEQQHRGGGGRGGGGKRHRGPARGGGVQG